MSLIDLHINAEGLQRLALELSATEAQVNKALNSTLIKMANWLRSKSIKGLSQHLAVPQKVVRTRLKSFKIQRKANGSEITVWYGLDPISLIHLRAKQSSDGVRAYGGRFVKSAFIANGKNGKPPAFKRAGKERLPLVKQVVDVADKANPYIEDQLVGSAEFEAQFMKLFEHELQWRTRTP